MFRTNEPENTVSNGHTALQRLDAKPRFLSSMSHELRTPLKAVLGFAHILLEEPESEQHQADREAIEHIKHAGEHLLRLVSDILDLASIESGRLQLDTGDVTMNGNIAVKTQSQVGTSVIVERPRAQRCRQ